MSAELVAGRYRHGHYLAYAKGRCRCVECQVAYRRRRKAGAVRFATYGPSLVDATEARVHVQGLLDAGVPVAQVAKAAGVDRTCVRRLVGQQRGHGPSKKLQRATAKALLGLALSDFDDLDLAGDRVPAVGTLRRLDALRALGWPETVLAQRLGTKRLRLGEGGWVRPWVARAVRELYDELSMTPGPSERTRSRAQRLGLAPPLAWDEEDLDDPAATPARAEPAPDVSGLGMAGLFEDYAWLLGAGEHPERAAKRCGRSLGAITKAAERAGRADLARAGFSELGHQRRKAGRP